MRSKKDRLADITRRMEREGSDAESKATRENQDAPAYVAYIAGVEAECDYLLTVVEGLLGRDPVCMDVSSDEEDELLRRWISRDVSREDLPHFARCSSCGYKGYVVWDNCSIGARPPHHWCWTESRLFDCPSCGRQCGDVGVLLATDAVPSTEP